MMVVAGDRQSKDAARAPATTPECSRARSPAGLTSSAAVPVVMVASFVSQMLSVFPQEVMLRE